MKRLPSHGLPNDSSVHYGLRNYPPGMVPTDDYQRSLFFNSLHKTSASSVPKPSTSLSFEAYIKRENSTRHLQNSAKTLLTSSSTSVPRQKAEPLPKVLRDILGLKDDEPFVVESECKPDPDVTPLQSRLFALQFNPDRDRKLLPPGDYDARLYDELTPAAIKQATISVDDNGNESAEPIDITNATFQLLANARSIECECELIQAAHQSTVVKDDQISVCVASPSHYEHTNIVESKPRSCSDDSAYESLPSTVGKRKRSVGLQQRQLQLGVISHYPHVVKARRTHRVENSNRLRRRSHPGVGVHQLFKIKSVRADRSKGLTRRAKMTFICDYEEEQTQ